MLLVDIVVGVIVIVFLLIVIFVCGLLSWLIFNVMVLLLVFVMLIGNKVVCCLVMDRVVDLILLISNFGVVCIWMLVFNVVVLVLVFGILVIEEVSEINIVLLILVLLFICKENDNVLFLIVWVVRFGVKYNIVLFEMVLVIDVLMLLLDVLI